MIFLNISSDKIQLSDWKKDVFLDRENLENSLWPVLVKLYKELNFKQIIILNWPWSFTHLRIWTLCVNLLNSLNQNNIKVYEISKPDFFQVLYDKWFFSNISEKMLMYIGQKKNVRKYDFIIKKYEITSFEKILKSDPKNYIFDSLSKEYRSSNLLLNNISIVSITLDKNLLKVSYKNSEIKISIEDLNLKSQTEIHPNYFIEANIN